jgi:putative transposase
VATTCRKYRIYPNQEQEKYLSGVFGATRFIYNWANSQRESRYVHNIKSFTHLELQAKLTFIRKTNEYSWLNSYFINTLQSALRHNTIAYQKFFTKKSGKPKYKSKKSAHQSFCVPNRYRLENSKLKLPMIKTWIQVKLHREMPDGVMKSCTISKEKNKYYISINFDTDEVAIKKPDLLAVGVDLNLKDTANCSDGYKIIRQRFTKNLAKRLAIRQRKLSKKVKGSNNRRKQREIVQNVHTKITNQRKDYNHKESKKLVDKYDIIVFEKLKVSNMIRNKKLSKSIADVSWATFKNYVKYKAEKQGKYVFEVNPSYTTQDCNICKYRNKSLTLSDRNWICPICNAKHCRDTNSAINILYKWYNTAGSAEIQASGATVSLAISKQVALNEEATTILALASQW